MLVMRLGLSWSLMRYDRPYLLPMFFENGIEVVSVY
jgi:hypothetical protein